MNIELFKELTLTDYNNRVNRVIESIKQLQNEKTGLFNRLLHTDRIILYTATSNILFVTQCNTEHNRDELSFVESICNLFTRHLHDTDDKIGLVINYHVFDDNYCKMILCTKNTPNSEPFLDFISCEDELHKIQPITEDDIHKLIDWYENKEIERNKSFIKISKDYDFPTITQKQIIEY